MTLGIKQRRVMNLILARKSITLEEVRKIYNLSEERAKDKIEEFESMLWIERIPGETCPLRWGKGFQFPLNTEGKEIFKKGRLFTEEEIELIYNDGHSITEERKSE